jgi:FolB domain-containing protein
MPPTSPSLDRIIIKNLLVRGIIGINPDERVNRQDIRVNLTMWADTRAAAASDDIADAVNYRTVAKAVIKHIEEGQPLLVERLAAELAQLCFQLDPRVQAVEVMVEKPGAVRFAESVGIAIYRTRTDMVDDG